MTIANFIVFLCRDKSVWIIITWHIHRKIELPLPATRFEISKQLELISLISHCGDSGADFAARIASWGCARIFLKEDYPDRDSQGTRVFHRREPDAQFQHRDAEYPGVVLETSYSQDGKDLKKLV